MAVLNLFRIIGDLMHLLSICILCWKIKTTRSCAGISLKSQALYMIVYVTRYMDLYASLHLDFLHLYNFLMKCFFLGSEALILYFMMNRFRSSYDRRMDSFRVPILVGPAIVLAFMFLDSSSCRTWFQYFREYMWTFSIILEAVAILPQLFQLTKTGEAESITTHYLVCMGLYRGFYILNWLWRWWFREDIERVAVLAGIVQTLLYSDLFYVYYNRVFRGQKLPL